MSLNICPNSVSLDQCYVGKIDQALTNFNTSFQCYQEGCLNNCAGNISPCNFINVVQPSYTKLIEIINEVISKTQPLNLINYDTSMNNIQTDYKSLLSLRENIENKMKDLSPTQGMSELYKEQFDNTIYTNIIWTILATTLVYLIFLKIKD